MGADKADFWERQRVLKPAQQAAAILKMRLNGGWWVSDKPDFRTLFPTLRELRLNNLPPTLLPIHPATVLSGYFIFKPIP